MCAAERCNDAVYKADPGMIHYDWAYYNQLLPIITGDVLDLGSGAGTFIREYVKKYEVKSVVAVDKYIEEIAENPKVTSIRQNLPSELLLDKKFDTIVATEFLEHIKREDLEPLLEEIKKHLKDTGIFIGSTPNKIAPTKNPYHLYEYTMSELASILKNYFPTVEVWDSGQNCTIFKCSLI